MRRWKKYKDMTPAERKRRNRKSYLKRRKVGKFDDADVRAQYCLQDGLCYWCMEELGDVFHKDHYKPVARGGKSEADNLVISCPHCNLSRGGKMPERWFWRKVHTYW